MITSTALFVAAFLFVNVAADGVDGDKCTYNSLIPNFNRKVHEDGQSFYECDEKTGYYVEKLCADDELFDAKILVSRFGDVIWIFLS